MPDLRQNQQQVLAFLQDHFAIASWEVSIPQGSGKEKYLARAATRHAESACFIKLGVNIPVYQTVASLELTPPILASGCLQDGTPLIVQRAINGRQPTWQDFSAHLDLFASTLQRLHHSLELRSLLAAPASETYHAAGLQFLNNIHLRWEAVRSHFGPEIDSIVLEHLDLIAAQLRAASGGGLANTHNDPCNANWLLAEDGRLYLLDLDSLARDDPAADLGPLLWWYYPPELRPRFVHLMGYSLDEQLQQRLRLRMALHNLHIALPRPGSFDHFDPDAFLENLNDVRLILLGGENPHGYLD